jgi:hypothetical protein
MIAQLAMTVSMLLSPPPGAVDCGPFECIPTEAQVTEMWRESIYRPPESLTATFATRDCTQLPYLSAALDTLRDANEHLAVDVAEQQRDFERLRAGCQ